MIVCAAEAIDIAPMLALCRKAVDEDPTGRVPSWGKIERMVRKACSSEEWPVRSGVASRDGEIIALVGLIVSDGGWYYDGPEINDWLTYILPQHRSIRVFDALIDFAHGQADLLRMPLVMGYIGDNRGTGKDRLYRRHFAPFGGLYRYLPQAK